MKRSTLWTVLFFLMCFFLATIFAITSHGSNEYRQKASSIFYSPLAIGDSSAADSKSILDVKSTTLGILPPRMTTTQRNAISSPTEGLHVYDSTLHVPTYYNGSNWIYGITTNTANTLVLRDSSGNFSAGTITAALSGNATTATTATNATNGTTVSTSSNASFFPAFFASSSNSNQPFNLGTGLTFNPSTNALTTTSFVGDLSMTAITGTEISTPSNPSASHDKAYFKADGSLYTLNSSGVEVKVGSGGGGGGLYAGGQNLISNNSGEVDTTGVTVSGGSLARVTAAANIVPPGVGSFSWDPSASGQTFSWPSVTVTANDGLSGQNGVMSCAVKTAATDMQMQVYDGSNVLTPSTATDLVPSSGAGFIRYTLNFVFPASGILTPRFKSQSNSAIAYIDDCFWGKAEGFNFYLNQVSQDWNNDLTFTGSASLAISSSDFRYKRIGDTMFVRGFFTVGTTTAAVGYIQLPSGLTIDTSKLPAQMIQVGTLTRLYQGGSIFVYSDGIPFDLFYDGSTNNQIFITRRIASSAFTKVNSDTITSSGDSHTFDFTIPITEWKGTSQGFKPDQVANSWAGYHDSDCTWTTTGGSFADPAIDSSCTFTETNNVNFGTVVSYNDGTLNHNYPGITFTPSRRGSYYACASTTLSQNTINQAVAVQLFDETNSKDLDQASIDDPTAGNYFHERVCGFIKPTSTAPISLGLRMRVSGGTGSIASAGVDRAIYWTIFQIDQSFPAPLLVNSIVTSTQGVDRIERVNFGGAGSYDSSCTSDPCTIWDQSGNFASAVNNSGTGLYRIHFTVPFSGRPTCTGSVINSSAAGYPWVSLGDHVTTSEVDIYLNTSASVNTQANGAASIICQGPR